MKQLLTMPCLLFIGWLIGCHSQVSTGGSKEPSIATAVDAGQQPLPPPKPNMDMPPVGKSMYFHADKLRAAHPDWTFPDDKFPTDGFVDLVAALEVGTLEDVRTALTKEPDVNGVGPSGETALCLLANRVWRGDGEDTAALRMLLQRGAKIDLRDGKGETALLIAAGRTDWEYAPTEVLLEALLRARADANARDNIGETAVFRLKDLKALDILVRNGARLNIANDQGDTPVHIAVRAGDEIWALALLKRGATINAKNAKGQTALRIARLGFRDKLASELQALGGTE